MSLAFVIQLALGTAAVDARELFVDVAGRGGACDDAHPGTTPDQPLCTIAAALRIAGPGDRVLVREGTYPERIVPRTDGTAEAPILIASFEGETASITGTESLASPGRLVSSDARLLVVERSSRPLGFIQSADRESAAVAGCPDLVRYTLEPFDAAVGDDVPREGTWQWDDARAPGRAYLRVPRDVARCQADGIGYTWLEIVRELDLSRLRHLVFRGIRFEEVTLRIAEDGEIAFEDCAFVSASMRTTPTRVPPWSSEPGGAPSSSPALEIGMSPRGSDDPVPPDAGPNPLSVAEGGTGATNPSAARQNLGAAEDASVIHLQGTELVGGNKIFSGPGTSLEVSEGLRAHTVGIGTDPSGRWGELDVAGGINLGANRAIYWPTFNPVQTRFFLGTTGSGTPLHGQDDNVLCRAYNTDCSGAKFVAGEHTFKDQLEATYDVSEGPGILAAVELNWDFSPDNTPYGWRTFGMFLKTWENDGDGRAEYLWMNQRGDVAALELRDGKAAFNRDMLAFGLVGTLNVFSRLEGAMSGSTFGEYLIGKVRHTNDGTSWEYVGSLTDVAYDTVAPGSDLGNLVGDRTIVRTEGANPGRSITRVIGHEINLVAGGSGNAACWVGLDLSFDPTGSNAAVDGHASLIRLGTPGPSGPGTTVNEFDGLEIENLGGLGTWNNTILVRTQTGGASKGNVYLQGGSWDNGHLTLGQGHFWFDPAGQRFRMKTSAPAAATDGRAIVTGTGVATHGPAAWAAAGTSGTSACAAMGMTCVTAYPAGGGASVNCSTSSGYRVLFCN